MRHKVEAGKQQLQACMLADVKLSRVFELACAGFREARIKVRMGSLTCYLLQDINHDLLILYPRRQP